MSLRLSNQASFAPVLSTPLKLPQDSGRNRRRSNTRIRGLLGRQNANSEEDARRPLGELQRKSLVIKPTPVTRQAGEPPKPISIEHTSSYTIKKRTSSSGEGVDNVTTVFHKKIESVRNDSNEEASPFEWILKKADESLDAAGERVPDKARGAITYVTGTMSTTASKYAVETLKLAAKGSSKILEAALPAGRWVLVKGVQKVSDSLKEKDKKEKESS